MSRIQRTTGQQDSNEMETAELTQAKPFRAIASSSPHRLHPLPRWVQSFGRRNAIASLGAVAAGAIAVLNPTLVQILERNAQTLFFELRGPVTPPNTIALVTIDDTTLGQAGIYQQDPVEFAELEPIQSWPWKRLAYARVIERLLMAGAKVVAVDVVLSSPSSYGDADDQALRAVLERYPGRVVLAEQFVTTEDLTQGSLYQRDMPQPSFRAAGAVTGFINLALEPDGKIHRFGEVFVDELVRQDSLFGLLLEDGERPQSFARATLQAAAAQTDLSADVQAASQDQASSSRRENIFFYGPNRSFPQIPFWKVLDSKNWNGTPLEDGAFQEKSAERFKDQFRDKIVLIGSTDPLQQDFHPVPFGHTGIYGEQLFGVEIQANAIATLQEGRAIADPLAHAWPLRGLLVLVVMLAGTWAIQPSKPPLVGLGRGLGAAAVWGLGSFAMFTWGQTILPVILPVLGLSTVGISQFFWGLLQEQRRKQQLRQALKDNASVPAIRDIISQQEDLKDILLEREAEMIGKILTGRYQITQVLGTGGFSETYVARDTHRPGSPTCVVKQLKLLQGKPSKIELVRRLFKLEAETLERLGQHPQIPLLLASFEEEYEFYLVQELIEGQSLHTELTSKARLPLYAIIQLLYDLLSVLEFVHAHQIIHRDIKPHNIIRRMHDGLFVLIDFGVAKKLSDRLQTDTSTQQLTIAIGTQGYISREQIAGKPNFTSDLYSLGVTAIEALTGLIPRQFQHDADGEICWTHRAALISEALQDFICRLVRVDYTERYGSAREALEALKQVPEIALLREERPQVIPGASFERLMQGFEDETEDASADTQIWFREG